MTNKHEKVKEFFKKVSDPKKLAALPPLDLKDNSEDIKDKLTINFLETVNKAMEDQKISQSDLAKKMGKTRQYIHRVLKNEGNFTLKTISEFCYHLSIKPEFIFCNSQENSQSGELYE